MTELASAALLDAAATSLATVAFGDTSLVSPAVRLPCLWAVEQLCVAGAVPFDEAQPGGVGVAERIGTALLLLSMLPVDVFAAHEVLEAAAAARMAFDAAGLT